MNLREKSKYIIFGFVFVLLMIIAILTKSFDSILNNADFGDSIYLLLLMPGFFILIGLIDAWLPASFIAAHLGKQSGFKGYMYSFLIGSLMIGPLYMAFPLAVILLKKGISKFNVTLFIGAWSVFPIGQEVFEIHFMGLKFFIMRAALSIVFVIISTIIMQRFKLLKENLD